MPQIVRRFEGRVVINEDDHCDTVSRRPMAEHRAKWFDSEALLILGMLTLFLGVNLWTATRFPIPWYDEIQFVDPAANLYFENSFTTTAYRWEGSTDLHAHHPLYSLVLAGWFEITGFGLTHARALNYVLMTGTVLAVWFAAIRTKLVPSATYRVVLVLLLLLGYSMSFPYRTGRIEPLLMLLSAMLWLIFTIKNRGLRLVLLAGATLLFAPAGLHLVVFTGAFICLLAVYLQRQVFVEAAVIGTALLLSTAGLFSFYALAGVWDNAVAAVMPHTTSGGLGALLTDMELTHINKLPKDPSLVILLGVLLLLVAIKVGRGQFRSHSVLSFGVAVSVTIPVVLLRTAKFPTYYSWMVFAPLAVCVCSALSEMRPRRWAKFTLHTGLALACIMGLPFQLLAVTYDWHDRNHQAVETIVDAHVGKSDWVLCDYQVYFPAKMRASKVFLPEYLAKMTPEEKSKISLVIASDEALIRWSLVLGGQWDRVGEGMVPSQTTMLKRLTGKNVDVGLIGRKYRFDVYRRRAGT